MRFRRLELLKFGIFAGQTIDFPSAKRDFHLIVGANEAGKSTLRSAILDLLFGIPMRSPHGFRHALSELRLGGTIEGAGGSLPFHRTKAQKQTLRTPADAVLPDAALAPYLGAADRAFFDQMFGMDHARLVEGGNNILRANSDVGQMLFQSAAGIASLGAVRDALLKEADELWAPRKSAGRAYYVAQDRLDIATARLKEATVRTKAWSEANSKVEGLDGELNAVRAQMKTLQTSRARLERVRRLAPYLRKRRQCEVDLQALGAVVELPEGAMASLLAAERDRAVAETTLEHRTEDAERARAALAELTVDSAVLALAAEIELLERQRVQYAPYALDIERREREIASLWIGVCAACAELDWPCDDPSVVDARLPKLLSRRELSRLARSFSGLDERVQSAAANEQAKRTEINELAAKLSAQPDADVPVTLRTALAAARAEGDTVATGRSLANAVAKASGALEVARGALGAWRLETDTLRAMSLPTSAAVQRQSQTRLKLATDLQAAMVRRDEQAAELDRLDLEIRQFTDRHHPTTREAVISIRRSRDTLWKDIRSGATPLERGADRFEGEMQEADKVADTRLEDVGEATQLQNLLEQRERESQSLDVRKETCRQRQAALDEFDASWARSMSEAGLPGMAVEDLGDWLVRRERVLEAAVALRGVQADADRFSAAVDGIRVRLESSMRDAGLPADATSSLGDLCAIAEAHCRQIDEAKVRREALVAQERVAQAALADLMQKSTRAQVDLEAWRLSWAAALAQNGLPANSPVATIEGALELIATVEEKLGKMREIRAERIDTMKADLTRFAGEAAALASRVSPDLAASPAAHVVHTLAARLGAAKEAHSEWVRLTASLRDAQKRVGEAKEAISRADASLQPLKLRAGAGDNDALRVLIEKSDRKRALETEREAAMEELRRGGDGLAVDLIEAEIDAADLMTLTADLARLEEDMAAAVRRQGELSAALADAQRELAAIGGSNAAAVAESMRQDALAQMAEAADRFVKVYTAGRLLRWSIDRYREEKQGPLLGRAGELFEALTLGSFRKLVVDFENDPPVLEGQRAGGERVGVTGMSDGTRDQLYLALRLAALELHMAQSTPLPFIADDLFINYDDDRSRAGLEALGVLSEKTQVIFLSHHEHLVPVVKQVFGESVSVTTL